MFRALPTDPVLSEEKLLAQFLTNVKGDVDRVSLPLEPAVAAIVFTRRPPVQLCDPAFLRTVTGTYALVDNANFTFTIDRKGETALTYAVPGQPRYDLEPVQGTEFRLKGLVGFSVRFLIDAAGNVVEAQLVRHDGVYSARRR